MVRAVPTQQSTLGKVRAKLAIVATVGLIEASFVRLTYQTSPVFNHHKTSETAWPYRKFRRRLMLRQRSPQEVSVRPYEKRFGGSSEKNKLHIQKASACIHFISVLSDILYSSYFFFSIMFATKFMEAILPKLLRRFCAASPRHSHRN